MDRSRKVIVACMRNEALFTVEWVAHHLAVGFDKIVIFTNDCDDGTDLLLSALQRGGAPVLHLDNPGPYSRGSIQRQALFQARGLEVVQLARWLMHIDADEYVNVTCGSRRIDDLIDLHPDVDGIALMWRHFGSSGVTRWNGGSVVEQFERCEAVPANPDAGGFTGFKTLFRQRKFKEFGVHHPKKPTRGRSPVIVNTAGQEMPLATVTASRGSGFAVTSELCTWDHARLHHHHVKSDDLHQAKYDRGDANGRNNAKRIIGGSFYQSVDRNEGRDRSLIRFRPAVRGIEAALRCLPGVAEAEAAALAGFQARYHGSVAYAAE